MEDLLVVSFFHPAFYLLEVTGLTGLYIVSRTLLTDTQIVAEHEVCVETVDQGVLSFVACDEEGGLTDLFLGRGGVVVHREQQVRKAYRGQPDGHGSLEDRRRPARERAGYGACKEEVDGG